MRDSPYWVSLAPGCTLGDRKGKKGGVWLAKLVRDALRQQTTIGPADEALDPDGVLAISYADAQIRAREWFASVTRPLIPSGRGASTTKRQSIPRLRQRAVLHSIAPSARAIGPTNLPLCPSTRQWQRSK